MMNPDAPLNKETTTSRKKTQSTNFDASTSKDIDEEHTGMRHPRKLLLRHVARSTKIIESLQVRPIML